MITVDRATGTLVVSNLTGATLAKTIDHSLLRPELTERNVEDGCELGARYDVAAVFVKPCHVALAARSLDGTDVKVGTVVGFPHGSSATPTKVFEARQALKDGAEELDMVINIGALRGGQDDYVREDISAVVAEAHLRGAIVKVIIEASCLTNQEKVRACQLAEQAGADFVATSTGYAAGGATVDDIRLMRANVPPRVGIKAAHGVRTLEAALDMLSAGATRISATATMTILDAWASLHPDEEA